MLVAAEAGAIAGAVTGYYNARSRRDTRRAESVSEALTFVNHLIRHDLKNDLTVIRGHAEVLDETSDGPAEPSVIVDKSNEALERIETTRAITATLTGDAEYETIDITEVCAELADQISEAFSVEVTTDLPETAFVEANDGIRPVVDNLLENAAEHNDADTPEIHIAVDTTGDIVRLVISDNGPGIPDDQKDRLFEPRRDSVSGGGLALIQTLVENYSGEVSVEDSDPRGSAFVVKLPRGDREQLQ